MAKGASRLGSKKNDAQGQNHKVVDSTARSRWRAPVGGVLVGVVASLLAMVRGPGGSRRDSNAVTFALLPANHTDHWPVRFKNLRSETVDVWWLDHESMSVVHQYTLAAGEQTSTLGEASRQFFFSPQDDPGIQLQEHNVVADADNLFVLEALAGDSQFMRRWAEEREFRDDYIRMTDRHWIAFHPREPPTHFMWPSNRVGDRTRLETPAGQYRCSDLKQSCIPESALSLDVELLSLAPRLFLVRGFLSAAEAGHLVRLGAASVQPSKTTRGAVSAVRTSSNTWIPRSTDAFTERIFQRISDVLQIPQVHSQAAQPIVEGMQLVHYRDGEEYKAHYDWWVSEGHGPRSRFVTFLLYLTDKAHDDAGGETVFPKSSCADGSACVISVHPGRGGAAFFYNILEDGNMDIASAHASMPIVHGEKWLANVWVWDPDHGPG